MSQLSNVRVLVVDDSEAVRAVFREYLESRGATVTVASSAAEGLAALQRERPHVLVSDITMAGYDGFWLIRQVRALPPALGGRTPAVAVTSAHTAADRARILAAGFQHHLPKPVTLAELGELIAACAGA